MTTRYQFTDGKGKRRHFATKAKAKVEAGKDKALYHQEGRLAAGLTDEQHRDAAAAVKSLPSGWTLTQAARFAAEHVSRIKVTLTVDEAVKRFLESREKRSDMHYKDLNRRLNRWLATIDRADDVATVEKGEIEDYLSRYAGGNQLNHLRALNNFFRFSTKIGAIGSVPTSGIDISFQRSSVCDNAKERCPFWPGQPIIGHWPSTDPADFVGTEQETYRHFWQVSRQIHHCIQSSLLATTISQAGCACGLQLLQGRP